MISSFLGEPLAFCFHLVLFRLSLWTGQLPFVIRPLCLIASRVAATSVIQGSFVRSMLCYFMSCDVMWCYVMSCYIMLHYVTFYTSEMPSCSLLFVRVSCSACLSICSLGLTSHVPLCTESDWNIHIDKCRWFTSTFARKGRFGLSELLFGR